MPAGTYSVSASFKADQGDLNVVDEGVENSDGI
jgi:hypothetical protein